MSNLSPEAKAELDEAVRIVASSRVLRHIRGTQTPVSTDPNAPTPPVPPPAKPPVVPPVEPKKKSLYWGDRLSDD